MSDLRSFASKMRLTGKAVGEGGINAVKEVTVKVGTAVVYATPVDTSRARMNWQGSVGVPATGVLLPAPSQPASPKDGPRVAMESIKAAAAEYNGQSEGVFITNNLDYIADLNNGSSGQAPANFVEQAVMIGLESASTVKILP